MEFFHLIKATQKSGKKDAVIWFTAKSAARANLQLDVELEDAGIETGRGKDYAKPIRTDMPVVNDLPEEGVIDYTWCERYALAEDGRTWNVIPGTASQSETTIAPDSATSVENQPAAALTATDIANVCTTSLLENRTPSVRFAVHLLGDKYLSEISQEQQIVATELASDEGNAYFQILMQAKNEVADISDLSLHAEWKLVQAVKDVFSQGKEHEPAMLATFMSGWIKADDRNQLVEDWKNGKSSLLQASVETDVSDNNALVEQGLVIDEHDDEDTRYPVVQMPFRKQLLAQFASDELRHHVTREEFTALGVLEMDTDNSYVQNLLLAAESCPELKSYDTKDLWRYTEAIRKVFSQDKRHELALLLRFTRIWAATDYINRGILAREWAAGNRISNVQRTDSGTNADGGYGTDRGEDAHHTLDTLDLEIACALLPMDFHHFEIPSSVLRRAKDVVTSKEQPWKSWSTILRNQPGVLSVNRAAIFNLIRIAPENIHLTPVAHLELINQTMTAEFNAATELVTVPAPAAKSGEAEQPVGGGKTDRNPNYKHDFDGLDTEIALATLSTDFNIYDIPSEEFRQAKAIVAANYSPFKEWSEALRATPGILDYSRAAIFALIRSAFSGIHFEPKHIRGHIHANLTETDHEHPTAEMLAAARHTPEVSWESEVNQKLAAEQHVLPKWVEAGEQKLADEDEAETQNLPKWAGSTASQPQVANLGGGMFSIDGLINESQPQTEALSPEPGETTSDVQMEKTHDDEVQNGSPVPARQDATGADESSYEAGDGSDAVDIDTGHQKTNDEPGKLFTHLMLDLETMGKKPGAPVVSIGAVFFAPDTGETGAEFYQVISLESCMSFGAVPDASTIIWWLKQSAQARSEIVIDDAVGLVQALEEFDDYIAANAANGSRNVQLWGNGSSFDCTLIEAAFELADIPFPIGHWNYRDVRTVVEMGKAVGLNCRYDIPFEGDQHHALADARHQVKYVSAIWQHLTAN